MRTTVAHNDEHVAVFKFDNRLIDFLPADVQFGSLIQIIRAVS